MNVIPGQSVKQGQLLVELEREDLTQEINEVEHNLEELYAQLKLNSELNSELKSMKQFRDRRRTRAAKYSLSPDGDDPLSIQIRSLEKRVKLLRQEEEELFIFSGFDGHIGFVNFKEGESVSPFDPILTMHKKIPTFVRGYVHEKLSHKMRVNQVVLINSLSSKKALKGIVKNVGNRIVEFPERFRRSSTEKIWGREVMVQLPKDNKYLLGEKVFMEIETKESIKVMSRALADTDNKKKKSHSYQLIPIKKGDHADLEIEPSGLAYIKDINKYLMVSDDTEKNEPYVYLMNYDGELDTHIIKAKGIKKIKDMEAITSDEEGNLYISSSQSPSKNGKITKERQKLVKLVRNGVELNVESDFELYDSLNDLAKLEENSEKDWVELLKNTSGNKNKILFDVEGIAVANNTMYLGLRNPNINAREVVILKIEDLGNVFKNKTVESSQISVFKKLETPIHRDTDRDEGISDLMIKDGKMYIVTASNRNENTGRVLKMSLEGPSEILEIVHFKDHRPEGITFDEATGEFIVCFDNNNGEDLFLASFSE